MSSINIDLSTLVIVALLIGPALVFAEFTKFVFAGIIHRRHKIVLSDNLSLEMPHKSVITYTSFPLALAGIIWITKLISFSPFDSLEADYLKLIFDPFWLLKYYIFMFGIAVCGMFCGFVAALGTPRTLLSFGIELNRESKKSETTKKSSGHPNRKSKDN